MLALHKDYHSPTALVRGVLEGDRTKSQTTRKRFSILCFPARDDEATVSSLIREIVVRKTG